MPWLLERFDLGTVWVVYVAVISQIHCPFPTLGQHILKKMLILTYWPNRLENKILLHGRAATTCSMFAFDYGVFTFALVLHSTLSGSKGLLITVYPLVRSLETCG